MLFGWINTAGVIASTLSSLRRIRLYLADVFRSRKDPFVTFQTEEPEAFEFSRGDYVTKTKGYEFSGYVLSAFRTRSGAARYVVECSVPGAGGMLHIYNGNQLGPKTNEQNPRD